MWRSVIKVTASRPHSSTPIKSHWLQTLFPERGSPELNQWHVGDSTCSPRPKRLCDTQCEFMTTNIIRTTVKLHMAAIALSALIAWVDWIKGECSCVTMMPLECQTETTHSMTNQTISSTLPLVLAYYPSAPRATPPDWPSEAASPSSSAMLSESNSQPEGLSRLLKYHCFS
jgi:hypothetical protein